MKILGIDSSGMVASVAIIEDEITVAEYSVNYKKTHSQTLLPMLDEIVKMTEYNLSDVDAIAVAAGPGSFTGLRIGSATVKGLGLALDKPVVSVPTCEALAYNVWNNDGIICPIMDARRNQVYCGLYYFETGHIKVYKEQEAVAVTDLVEYINQETEISKVTFLGDGVPIYRNKIDELIQKEAVYAPAHLNRQRAASVATLGKCYYEEGKFENANLHNPIYLRKSQAEREREAKNDKSNC